MALMLLAHQAATRSLGALQGKYTIVKYYDKGKGQLIEADIGASAFFKDNHEFKGHCGCNEF